MHSLKRPLTPPELDSAKLLGTMPIDALLCPHCGHADLYYVRAKLECRKCGELVEGNPEVFQVRVRVGRT